MCRAVLLGDLLPFRPDRSRSGGFSDFQLALTLVGEAAIPFIIIALYIVQRPPIGRIGLVSSIAYAYAYVFFTFTVIYALSRGIPTYDTLSDDLGLWMLAHGALMVVAGLGFGYATIKAEVLPKWTGLALMAGVVAVSATQSAPEGVQVVAAGVRDLAIAGMARRCS